jgi:hypothetical protein
MTEQNTNYLMHREQLKPIITNNSENETFVSKFCNKQPKTNEDLKNLLENIKEEYVTLVKQNIVLKLSFIDDKMNFIPFSMDDSNNVIENNDNTNNFFNGQEDVKLLDLLYETDKTKTQITQVNFVVLHKNNIVLKIETYYLANKNHKFSYYFMNDNNETQSFINTDCKIIHLSPRKHNVASTVLPNIKQVVNQQYQEQTNENNEKEIFTHSTKSKIRRRKTSNIKSPFSHP